MRRSLGVRIATLVFVVFASTSAFAMPSSDDSPIGGIERAIARMFQQVKQIIVTDLEQIGIPK